MLYLHCTRVYAALWDRGLPLCKRATPWRAVYLRRSGIGCACSHKHSNQHNTSGREVAGHTATFLGGFAQTQCVGVILPASIAISPEWLASHWARMRAEHVLTAPHFVSCFSQLLLRLVLTKGRTQCVKVFTGLNTVCRLVCCGRSTSNTVSEVREGQRG